MWDTGLLKATGVSNTYLDKAPNPKMRVTFASLPREVRNKIYEELFTVKKIINNQCAGDFGCPKEWETMRAMFRASPASEKFAVEAYETFFRSNTFQMVGDSPGSLARKTYYVRNHGWSGSYLPIPIYNIPLFKPVGSPRTLTRDSHAPPGSIVLTWRITTDMKASVRNILIEHQTLPRQVSLFRQLRMLMACPRLSHVTVRVLPSKDQTSKSRLLPKTRHYEEVTTDKILREITQVCQELMEKIGEGLIFETKCPHIEERIKNWAQYMKVCRELREKTDQILKTGWKTEV